MEQNITTCVPQNTAYNLSITNYKCSCKEGFYDTFCEIYIPWTVTVKNSIRIIQTINCLIICILFVLRLIDLKRTKSLVWNLSMASLCMTVFANIILVAYIWIPQNVFVITDTNIYLVGILVVVLVFPYFVLTLGSTNLIAGFWLEVLTRKITEKHKLAQTTKKVVICFCVGTIVSAIIGMCIAIANFQYIWLAYIFILGPLIINIIATFIISIIIACIDTKNMNQKNIDKHSWVTKILIPISVLWFLCIIGSLISLSFNAANIPRQYSIIPSAINSIFECTISLLLMLLFDYRFKSVQRVVFSGIMTVDSHDTVMRPNTTTTLNTSSSKFTLKNQTDIAQTMTASGTS